MTAGVNRPNYMTATGSSPAAPITQPPSHPATHPQLVSTVQQALRCRLGLVLPGVELIAPPVLKDAHAAADQGGRVPGALPADVLFCGHAGGVKQEGCAAVLLPTWCSFCGACSGDAVAAGEAEAEAVRPGGAGRAGGDLGVGRRHEDMQRYSHAHWRWGWGQSHACLLEADQKHKPDNAWMDGWTDGRMDGWMQG